MQQRAFSRARWRHDRHHLSFAQFQVRFHQHVQFFLARAKTFSQSTRFQQHLPLLFFFLRVRRAHWTHAPCPLSVPQGSRSHGGDPALLIRCWKRFWKRKPAWLPNGSIRPNSFPISFPKFAPLGTPGNCPKLEHSQLAVFQYFTVGSALHAHTAPLPLQQPPKYHPYCCKSPSKSPPSR